MKKMVSSSHDNKDKNKQDVDLSDFKTTESAKVWIISQEDERESRDNSNFAPKKPQFNAIFINQKASEEQKETHDASKSSRKIETKAKTIGIKSIRAVDVKGTMTLQNFSKKLKAATKISSDN